MISEEELNHKDVMSSEMLETEKNVKTILQSFDHFSNPFETDQKEDLFCLSSGKPAPKVGSGDLLSVEEYGKTAFTSFIQQRLDDNFVSFHVPMRRQILTTFCFIT